MIPEQEIWKQAVNKDYEPIIGYSVSSEGRLKGPRGKVMAPYVVNRGYRRINIKRNGSVERYLISNLVALAFPEICGRYTSGLTVDHLNGKTLDDRAVNLRFKTLIENFNNPVTYPKRIKALKSNIIHTITPQAMLKKSITRYKRVMCISTLQVFLDIPTASEATGVCRCMVWQCCAGRRQQAKGLEFKYAD